MSSYKETRSSKRTMTNNKKHNKKQLIKKILCRTPGILRYVAYRTRHLPRIFMYHRFTPENVPNGHVVSALNFEWQLRQLPRHCNVMTLAEYIQLRRQNAPVPPYTVIFTIDDGYRDFYDVAYPLLRTYRYPATFFATTAFVEGDIWLWPDRLHYVLEQTQLFGEELTLGNETVRLLAATAEQKGATWQLLSDYCINVPDDEKWRVIKHVEDCLQVGVPDTPTFEFAAASWEQLREMVANGIEVGGHTVTHPVLSRLEPANLYDELVRPKTIIEEKTGKAPETFCYPNGRDADITSRVLEIVKANGWMGAVQGSGIDFSNLYRLPRFGVTNDRLDFLWKLSGFEQMLWK